MRLKIILIIFFFIYQNNAYSKNTEVNQFNQKYLSSYFSALILSKNQKNDEALKYFNSSKFLINKHDNFLKEYLFSLVLNGQVKKAINQTKHSNNSNFFESYLLQVLNNLEKKNYKNAKKILNNLSSLQEIESYEYVIIKILESYTNLFLSKKIDNRQDELGNIDLITKAFQNCYLNSNLTNSYFTNLINSPDGDYSRYLFFYLGNIIENGEYQVAQEISKTIEPLNSTLLINQANKWISEKKYKKFTNYFSCKNENDLLAEFFFLISNLYSSDERFKKSNFYLQLSNYLNPNFYFNLSLLVENYHFNNNFELAKKILKKFNSEDKIYNWYKIKKIAQIINEQKGEEKSLEYIEEKIKNFKNPSTKILYDVGNIYKSLKMYQKSIKYYSIVLSKINNNSSMYADILYRRGGSYERIGEYKKADSDLLQSLKIEPNEPYTLNYLAYSWLERNYKIEEAIEMLHRAFDQKKDDPYITDSVGWGYYLIGDYENAEKYLRRAVELMPYDPIVNDHYGDVLWQLNRKIQAKYFWKNVLDLEDTEEKMKKNIFNKLLNGPNKI